MRSKNAFRLRRLFAKTYLECSLIYLNYAHELLFLYRSYNFLVHENRNQDLEEYTIRLRSGNICRQ